MLKISGSYVSHFEVEVTFVQQLAGLEAADKLRSFSVVAAC